MFKHVYMWLTVTGNWRVKSICHCFKLYTCKASLRALLYQEYIRLYSSLQKTTCTRIKTNPTSLSQRNTSFTGSPWQQATQLLHSTILGFQAGTRCVTSSLPYVLVKGTIKLPYWTSLQKPLQRDCSGWISLQLSFTWFPRPCPASLARRMCLGIATGFSISRP